MGRFTVSNVMNIKSGGKVKVETDQNGVPNQRSGGLLGSFLRGLAKNSSHVPLHIARWDNKLLEKPKKDLITYVEVQFIRNNSLKFSCAFVLTISFMFRRNLCTLRRQSTLQKDGC